MEMDDVGETEAVHLSQPLVVGGGGISDDGEGFTHQIQQIPDYAQSAAITSSDPAVLVVAGPGSGKTRVLSARLAFLLMQGTSPSEILVLSFTNSAADNLCAKAASMLQVHDPNTVASTDGVSCDTFHGFCSSVIQASGMQGNKKIIIADDEDQMRIMLALLESKGLTGGRSRAVDILRQIRYWKELGLGYLGVRAKTLTRDTERLAYELYPEYQARLKMLSAVDFGDLLLYTLRLFRTSPKVLDSHRARFKHVLVDEFQDVSPAQYDILRMLVLGSTSSAPIQTSLSGSIESDPDPGLGLSVEEKDGLPSSGILFREDRGVFSAPVNPPHRINVFCAGDDDQSIYAWRGAQVELMRRFRFDFPGAQVMRFSISYRMPDTLCQISNKVVSSLPKRISKTLVGQSGPSVALPLLGQSGTPLDVEKLGVRGDRARAFKTIAAATYVAAGSVVSASTAGAGAGAGARDRVADVSAGTAATSQSATAHEIRGDEDSMALLRRSQAAVEVRRMADEKQELDWIVSYVKQVRSSKTAADALSQSGSPEAANKGQAKIQSVAILVRSVADVKRVSDGLAAHKIAFRSRGTWALPKGGLAPLSLLRLVATPDDDVAFETAMDNDIVGAQISLEEMARLVLPEIRLAARSKGSSLLEATRECVLKKKLKGEHRKSMENFLRDFQRWRQEVQRFNSKGKGEAARSIVKGILRSAYAVRGQLPEHCISRAIDELSRSASSFDSLQNFFSTIRSQTDYVLEESVVGDPAALAARPQSSSVSNDATADQEYAEVASLWESVVTPYSPGAMQPMQTAAAHLDVWVMTMFAAKGLEFDQVFLPFWADTSQGRLDVSPEDRRIAFVSLTRSRQKVMISYSGRKHPRGPGSLQQFPSSSTVLEQQPSRIVLELLELKSLVHFEDVSVLQRLQMQGRPAQATATASTPASARTESFPSLNPGAWNDFLNDDAGPKNVAAVSNNAGPIVSEGMVMVEPATAIALVEPATTTKKSSKSKSSASVGARKPRAAAPPTQLPLPASLTPQEINRLMYDSRSRAIDLKALFKSALAELGLVRGSIAVGSGAPKALSKCTAIELGKHLNSHLEEKVGEDVELS